MMQYVSPYQDSTKNNNPHAAWEIEEKYNRQQNIQAKIDTNIDGSVQNFDQNFTTVFSQRL